MGARVMPMLQLAIPEHVERLYVPSDFVWPPLDLAAGPILLHGMSNAGKTSFAICAHPLARPLVVKMPDDLKRLSIRTDGLIFDDCDFSRWHPTEVIALLDFELARSVPARYFDGQIPAFMPMIFTSNVEDIFPAGRNDEQQRAIDRRIRKVRVGCMLQKAGVAASMEERRARRAQAQNAARALGTE